MKAERIWKYPVTPDGRYYVAKKRLWRCSDPSLTDEEYDELVREFSKARREIWIYRTDATRQAAARAELHKKKVELGERGEPWWDDGMQPVDQKHPKNTKYAEWWFSLSEEDQKRGIK